MYYEKNKAEKLSDELFRDPTAEYRGAPFWAWNCKLEPKELLRQIDIFKEMGLGGFHMHVRTGMETEYLSDEFLGYIKECVEKAKSNNMLAYLYDEDRWPSGTAGGYVTAESDEYRKKRLRITAVPYSDKEAEHSPFLDYGDSNNRTEEGSLLTCFDIVLDENGCLKSYREVGETDPVEGTRWYAYLELGEKSAWFNNQSYIDTLSKPAMDRFIDITYNAYLKTCGEDFGKVVPSIFTDEPQVSFKERLEYSTDLKDATIPWTTDFEKTYKETYGEDIIKAIPELFWELPNGKISTSRYHYHDHVAARFVAAFADNCGRWCQEHNLMLTGHMMEEQDLISQTRAHGEAMRNYRSFQLPGIDMLCGNREFTTAKQAQSAVHQYGKEAMLSELYGVTGWDFDLRSHKLHGDWQAALGVTLRVQHLSWVSMKGEAKRDYPASISYQSPWYTEYRAVEDHFARVNTALTRGKPLVKVGVIHPIESSWLHWGPNDREGARLDALNRNFIDFTGWLTRGLVDFDFICESLLPEQCNVGGAPLTVGQMQYDTVIVPGCETLRGTTLDRLEQFQNAGGKLIFMGSAPTLCDAKPSARAKALYDRSEKIDFTKNALLEALSDDRILSVRFSDGKPAERYCHQLRQDNDCTWLFLAQCVDPESAFVANKYTLDIALKGAYSVTLYNTMTGETEKLPQKLQNGFTVIRQELYDYGSLLLKYEPSAQEACAADSLKNCDREETPMKGCACAQTAESENLLSLPCAVNYTLSEPNALLLDLAEFSIDGAPFGPEEEILRIDNLVRDKIGLPRRCAAVAQPWVVPDHPEKHKVTLRFTVDSEISVPDAHLALEDAEKAEIKLNGVLVDNRTDGYYVDRAIKTVLLPMINAGQNTLEVTLPLSERVGLEWCYLVGDFGVRVFGQGKRITKLPEKLYFGDIVSQGLPFYGGNITYEIPVKRAGRYTLHVPHYRGGILSVADDCGRQNIMIPPYNAAVCTKTDHAILKLTLFGNRYNAFGHVHCANESMRWLGPDCWRTEDDCWSYEYHLRPLGVLSTPKLLKD